MSETQLYSPISHNSAEKSKANIIILVFYYTYSVKNY